MFSWKNTKIGIKTNNFDRQSEPRAWQLVSKVALAVLTSSLAILKLTAVGELLKRYDTWGDLEDISTSPVKVVFKRSVSGGYNFPEARCEKLVGSSNDAILSCEQGRFRADRSNVDIWAGFMMNKAIQPSANACDAMFGRVAGEVNCRSIPIYYSEVLPSPENLMAFQTLPASKNQNILSHSFMAHVAHVEGRVYLETKPAVAQPFYRTDTAGCFMLPNGRYFKVEGSETDEGRQHAHEKPHRLTFKGYC